ncbi:MAG: methyltransferase domain-containing protein [Ornithinimicrobium sp.]
MALSHADERTLRRYRALAPVYDIVSLERLLYRDGREAAVAAAQLTEGQQVLDVGCGTGLTMPAIAERIGPTGHLIGIDSSPAMLAQASKRTIPARRSLIHADAQHLSPESLTDHGVTGPIEAALFCYSLSVMPDWASAWESVIPLLAPGARVAIADLGLPSTGGPPARFLARILTRVGRSNIEAQPWTALQESCSQIEHHALKGGHVQVWAGTLR